MNNQDIKNELVHYFTQFFKTFDQFKIPGNDTFSFIPEWIDLFEKLGFPNWHHLYPSLENIENSPLAFVKNPEQEIFQDFSDLDKTIDTMQTTNRLKELVTDEQRKSKDPFINDEQANIIFYCYTLMNMGFLGAIYGENPFELLRKAKQGERESILKVIQVDKSLIGTDWSMREIKKAHLSGDEDYLKKLSKALAKKPFVPKKRNLKLT